MKVILNTNYAHPEYGSASPGDELDLPKSVAMELVAGNYARKVRGEQVIPTAMPPQAEVADVPPSDTETASAEPEKKPAEQAAPTPPRRRRSRASNRP